MAEMNAIAALVRRIAIADAMLSGKSRELSSLVWCVAGFSMVSDNYLAGGIL